MSVRPPILNGAQLSALSNRKVFMTMRVQKGDQFGRPNSRAAKVPSGWCRGVCAGCGEDVWVSDNGRAWDGEIRCWSCG